MNRTSVCLVAAVVVSAGTAVYALAGHVPGNVPSITGCLTSTGKLVKLKVGDAPKGGSCGAQTEVHLSGGDITAVLAGYGLDPRSGGTQGSVTLGVDPTVIQNRVSKACGTDAAISTIKEDGSIDCDTDDGIRNVVAIREADEGFNSTDTKIDVADCPPGTVVVGGGAAVSPENLAFIAVSQPNPFPNPNSWAVVAREQPVHNLNWQVEAYVICANSG